MDKDEVVSFLATMERVKSGLIHPDQRNPVGCTFPHCSCNSPWTLCEKEFQRGKEKE